MLSCHVPKRTANSALCSELSCRLVSTTVKSATISSSPLATAAPYPQGTRYNSSSPQPFPQLISALDISIRRDTVSQNHRWAAKTDSDLFNDNWSAWTWTTTPTTTTLLVSQSESRLRWLCLVVKVSGGHLFIATPYQLQLHYESNTL